MAMNFYRSSNILVELRAEIDNYRRNRYPAFVYSRNTRSVPVEIPVFSFHSADPETLDSKLAYLARNGYETLTADEYLALRGEGSNRRRALLTFDDGNAQLWTVAYPLLKKRGMKAVAFVLPGETNDAAGPRAAFDGSFGEGTNDDPLCTWPELQAMGGVIDVQSHSLYHWIIFVSTRLACFFTPRIRDRWPAIDLPIAHRGGADVMPRNHALGVPFYEMDSRLSDALRVFEPAAVARACASFVADNGDEEFFKARGWFEKLEAVHGRAMEEAAFDVETKERRGESVAMCLRESKRILDNRLGKSVSHLCLPFGVGGETAIKAAADAGYRAVYWGTAPGAAMDDMGARSVTRIKDDYLFRLPGEGRWPLSRIFTEKVKRRARAGLSGKGAVR